jgi:hypothetical protein
MVVATDGRERSLSEYDGLFSKRLATGPLGAFYQLSLGDGHTSPVGVSWIVALGAHAGIGGHRGRSSAIRRRISANSVLGTATSAIWKAT